MGLCLFSAKSLRQCSPCGVRFSTILILANAKHELKPIYNNSAFVVFAEHLKSKKHKRRYGLLKKKRTETVRILEKREKQLSEIKDENFERSNIDITESIEKNSS